VQTLVIRFSSLGDIVLTGAVTGALGPVSFLTHPQYADLARALPGVTSVIRWGQDPITGPFDKIVDLHGSTRSRWIAARTRGKTRTISRYSMSRRLRVWLKTQPLIPSVVDRYAAAAQVSVAPKPWIQVGGPRDALILIPCARWTAKRWPIGRYAELARDWEGPVIILGGPGDLSELRPLQSAIGSDAELIAEAGFQRTLEALGRGALAVGGDTGLLHLCAAAGVPALPIFGPTCSTDGFWCHEGPVLEEALSCRPCSRHGENDCPIGDHLCMEKISVTRVQTAMETIRCRPSC
jgi:heptosyltransferase-2